MPPYPKDGVIKILRRKIPANTGTKLYDGLIALKEQEGKTYQQFRDSCGGPKGSSARKFSPSDTIRTAIKARFARLE